MKVPEIRFKNIPLNEQERPRWNQRAVNPKPKPQIDYPKVVVANATKNRDGEVLKMIEEIDEIIERERDHRPGTKSSTQKPAAH